MQGLLASLRYDRLLPGCEIQQVACFSCEAPVLGLDRDDRRRKAKKVAKVLDKISKSG
jgi:hypothetical protein